MTVFVMLGRIVGPDAICEIVSEGGEDGRITLRDGPPEIGRNSMSTTPARPPVGTLVSSALFSVCVWSLGPAPAMAGEPAGAAPLGRLALSARVAEWGRADKNPLALIVAAEIRRSIGARTVERSPEQDGPTDTAATATETTVESLLAEAVALGGRDATIAALADDVRGSASKGLVQGAGMSRATLRGAGTDWYRKLKFEGTRYAEAYVELSGAGNVHVSVYDETGNLVCRDPNPSAVAYCGWVPSRTGSFDVKVENRSSSPVAYRMFTN